jgi:hypothetical protein
MARAARATVAAGAVLAVAAPSTASAAPRLASVPAVSGVAAIPADQGLRFESHAVYTVDPAAHAVHVGVDVALTNTMPDRRVGNQIESFYFASVSFPLLSEATNVSASRSGRALTVRIDGTESPAVSVATATLSPTLRYGSPQTIHFAYDLPSLPPRSEGITRVNEAFASFFAWSYGDPNITSVQLRIPDGLDVELSGSNDLVETEENGQQVFTANAIADPLSWGVAVVARDDSKLLGHSLTVDGHAVQVHAWPDDAGWSDFVDGEVTKGLPELETLIGLQWPDTLKDLGVTETVTPYLYGYAGWYQQSTNSIEIGDALDSHVVLHELAHLWFNKSLFTNRWIAEAMADEYAARAQAALGETMPGPEAVTPTSENHFPLNDWPAPNLQDESSEGTEQYGYNAAWTVARAIVDEIGVDGLAKVLAAAADRSIAYTGDAKPEKVTGAADWKRLLDLVDEVGGSTKADELFSTWVVALGGRSLFTSRGPARDAYQKLQDHGDTWAPPLAVRNAMSDWQFPTADRLIDDSQEVLGLRDRIAAELKPLGLHVPAALEREYESAAGDVKTLVIDATSAEKASSAIVAADKAVHGHHGFWSQIGLLGGSANHALGDAEDDFATGHSTAALAEAKKATKTVESSTSTGQQRSGMALAAIVLASGGGLLVRRGVRRRALRRDAEAAAAAAPARPWAPWVAIARAATAETAKVESETALPDTGPDATS